MSNQPPCNVPNMKLSIRTHVAKYSDLPAKTWIGEVRVRARHGKGKYAFTEVTVYLNNRYTSRKSAEKHVHELASGVAKNFVARNRTKKEHS